MFPLNAILYNKNKILGIVYTKVLILATIVQNFLGSYLENPQPPLVSPNVSFSLKYELFSLFFFFIKI